MLFVVFMGKLIFFQGLRGYFEGVSLPILRFWRKNFRGFRGGKIRIASAVVVWPLSLSLLSLFFCREEERERSKKALTTWGAGGGMTLKMGFAANLQFFGGKYRNYS